MQGIYNRQCLEAVCWFLRAYVRSAKGELPLMSAEQASEAALFLHEHLHDDNVLDASDIQQLDNQPKE